LTNGARAQDVRIAADIADKAINGHHPLAPGLSMFYVLRDAQGQISSLHRDPVVGAQTAQPDDPDVLRFLDQDAEQQRFAHLDAGLVRVLEDLIDALIRRNVLNITDLPMEAQHKLFDRKHFRDGMHGHALDLFHAGHARAPGADATPLDWTQRQE
jgi:hypothetical protein